MMTGAPSDHQNAEAAMRGYRYKHGDRPLEGYTVQRAAGRGAFGEVYFAISDSGREVALKVVLTYEQIELRGIGQCMNLKSPHLVSVFDVREGDHGMPVVIMEYVAGPSLRDLLDESPSGFGTQKAAFFLREIGKGLTYLHDCGIVHRDLKPANIFYENGFVKIGDYGLSKAISTSHHSAQTVTVGTLHYMAPEVGAGRYDRSVDIYALGALLYEMLTGQPPFFGVSPAEVLMKHISAPVQVEGIEEPFATVIRRALAKDPAERYQSVQEMVEGVFGAEHIRQSVSCFAPASLTMVAGRVAGHAAGLRDRINRPTGGPLSSRAYDVAVQPRDLEPATADDLRSRVRRFGAAARAWTRGVWHRSATPVQIQSTPQTTPVPAPPTLAPDPLSSRNRGLLAAIAMLAVAIAAAIFADDRNPAASGWFVLLGTLGATFGLRLALTVLLPDLSRESRFIRHLAVGGLASAFMVFVTLPAWAPAHHARGWEGMRSGHTVAAIALSLLAIDWTKRTSPKRRGRVLLEHLLVVGGVAIIFAAVLDTAPEVVIGVLCGTCIAIQLLSPWQPLARPDVDALSTSPGVPAADSAVPQPPAPEPRPAVQPLPSVRPPAPVSPLKLARQSLAAGRYIVMSPIRLLLRVVAFAVTLAAFVLATLLALDLPGWLASGRVDPNIPREMRRGIGVENWPFVLRSIGGVALFVAACLALALIMWVRRARGTTHLLRGILGAGLLIAAPFVLASNGINWDTTFLPTTSGWSAWQELVQTLHGGPAFRAAILFAAALVLLLWPAAPRRTATASDPSAPSDVTPTLAAAAHK